METQKAGMAPKVTPNMKRDIIEPLNQTGPARKPTAVPIPFDVWNMLVARTRSFSGNHEIESCVTVPITSGPAIAFKI